MEIAPQALVEPVTSAVKLAVEFVRTIEAWGDAAAFFADGAREEELPNRIFAKGAIRDLEAMKAGMARGKQLFATQSYVIHRGLGQGDVAVLELEWIGELGVKLGNLAPGEKMRVRGAFFFDVAGGKIQRLRHYDCFDPF